MNQNTALLILDAQVNMFDEKFHVYHGEQILKTISSLTEKARLAGKTVIYIRNDGGIGEPDQLGTPGWEIHPKIAPQDGDIILDKTSPNAFQNTQLQQVLDAQGANKLIIVGMQTEMCIATTCRKATELGYDVILVEDGHTTFDWEEISAIDAIAKCNAELSELIDITPAAKINFK